MLDSKLEAELKRLFEQGAIKVDGEKVIDFKVLNDLKQDTIIQIGKGSFYKIVI